MTTKAIVDPMHKIAAAANAAEEKAVEDPRNFQNSPSIAVAIHVDVTNKNLCKRSAYALSLNVASKARIAKKQSQDVVPRYSDAGRRCCIKNPAGKPSEAAPKIKSQSDMRFHGESIRRIVLSLDVLARSSPLAFRQRISALTAKNITQPELSAKA